MIDSKIRIFIVDDHQMLIDGIQALLKNDKRFSVVGTATSGNEALTQLEMLKPDILLSDVQMPEIGGLALTKLAKEKMPDLKVLILTMYCDRTMISEMLDAGISGYILKNTGKTELKEALNKVFEGGLYFSDEVALEMIKSKPEPENHKSQVACISDRELEIVKLIAADLNNSKIAEKLFISERTVETHRKNIFRKTNTHTAIGLIKYAQENGLI